MLHMLLKSITSISLHTQPRRAGTRKFRLPWLGPPRLVNEPPVQTLLQEGFAPPTHHLSNMLQMNMLSVMLKHASHRHVN